MYVSFAFALLLAQSPDPVTVVEGRVLDSLGNLPIAQARVILARIDKPGIPITMGLYEAKPSKGEPDPKSDRLVTLTRDDGMFRFRVEAPAKIKLFVDAKGFVRTPTHISPDTTLSVEPGRPKTGIVLRMTRALTISGCVMDRDTGQPVPNLEVRAHSYRNYGSGRILIPDGGSAKTDTAGRFCLENVLPGEYYLEIAQPLRAKIEKPEPIEDFRGAVRQSYVSTWYPGVERFAEASSVTLVDGATIEGIEIQTKKRRTAAIRGRVFGGRQGEVSVSLTRVRSTVGSKGFEMVAIGQIPGDAEYEVDHLTPGRYYILAEMKGATPGERRVAVLPLKITGENQDGMDLHLMPCVNLTGSVRIAGRGNRPDEPALPDENVRIGLYRALGMGIAGDPEPALVESRTGAFVLKGVVPDRYQVLQGKAPEGYNIAEVLYNHTRCPSGMVSIDPAASIQRLDITLAPADAAISATVTDGSRPVAGASVLLVPDAAEDDAIDFGPTLRHALADEKGRVVISDLLTGNYRITAYPKDALWREDPELKRRLRSGQEVRIAPHQPTIIEVRIR
ncbi:MAG TPA: carboxypeptidase-like regulatory domain-containing protein [Bryobacteraceae bacterium]|nr:carboxypeptidase-like regulatory domain-containing protein [Bryobacteraceae bacterium]